MTSTTLRSIAVPLIVIVLIVACGTSGVPSAPPITLRTDTPAAAVTPASPSPAAAVTAASPSPAAAVTPASPSPTATRRPTPKPTPVPVPPKPTGVSFVDEVSESDDGATAEFTQAVAWRAPRSKGVEIRVYGVTECIAEPARAKPGAHGPCLVTGTPLPASVRTLLATVPASDGVVSWTWTEESGCNPGLSSARDGPAYFAVVLAAYGASGHSVFAIAEPGFWSEPEPGDTVC